jgi:superfamily II DNA or RNA helicase
MDDFAFEIEEVAVPAFQLRGRQKEWCDAVEQDLASGLQRLLFTAAGGVGKSTCFAELARRSHVHGKKSLVIINRESLVRQSAKRIANETGIEVDVEMADDHASPYAPIVVASVQTLGRVNRLTGFDPGHFDRVMVDECHLSMCDQWLRIMNWFVYGECSLAEDWERPTDNVNTGLASVIGFTATPIKEGKKNLMNWFQHESVNYPYFQAVQEGWLVNAEQVSIPVKIDLRHARRKQTELGTDLNTKDISEALIPVIEQLADQMVLENAMARKSMCFLPSVETSRMMAEALSRRGFDACFVSGACEDGDEKTERFRAGGKGSVLCNAQIYNYGIDFPAVDCIGWFRPTMSRPFYLQGVFRGSRVLPGILDGLETAEDRLCAIANSAKKNFLIIDPLFKHEDFPLCDAYDLYAESPEVKEKMKSDGLPPTQESAERAGRDMIKALEKAARKQANKKARKFDALSWAVNIGNEKLANYQPTLAWHSQPPTEGQLTLLRRWGFDPSGITMKGLASEMIGTLTARKSLKLATPAQLNFMHTLGIPDDEAAKLTEEAANAAITRAKAERGWA